MVGVFIPHSVVGLVVIGDNVSVEIENRDIWLCCGWNYLGFILTVKAAQDWRWRWAMVPGIGWRFGVFEGD